MLNAVVDIGNSRIKMCRCDDQGLVLPIRGLSLQDTPGRDRIVDDWGAEGPRTWASASTVPSELEAFRRWAETRGDRVIPLDSHQLIPIASAVDEPSRVGTDRLLNAFAARSRLRPGEPAIIADAGSAVTVDLVDERGIFVGGTIFPGVRLMAESLHTHTAQLPLVDLDGDIPDGPPGRNTRSAIHLGILHAVAGGIDSIVHELASRCRTAPTLFLTGGDMNPRLAGLLQCRHQFQSQLRSALTLEGIFLAASPLA